MAIKSSAVCRDCNPSVESSVIFKVGVLDTELTNLIHKVGYPKKSVMLRLDMSGSIVLQ